MTFTAKERRLMTAMMKQPTIQQQNIGVLPFQAVPANLKIPDFPKVPNTGAQDYASYMLTHSSADKKASDLFGKSIASRDDSENHRASLLNHLFDFLSIPLYGSANALSALEPDANKSFIENLGDEAKGIGKAFLGTGLRLAGTGPQDEILDKLQPGFKQGLTKLEDRLAPKITGEDILHEHGVNNKFARYGGGLAIDFAIDPLSYVPLAPAVKALKEGPAAIKALMGGGKEALDAKAAASPGTAASLFAHAQAQEGGLAKPGYTMTRGNELSALGRLNRNGLQLGARGTETPLPAIPKLTENPKFKLPEVPVAEQAIKQSIIPRIDPTDVPRVNPTTPLMDAAQESIASQPLTRGLRRTQASARFAKEAAARDSQLASDVEKGLVDIPNPARTSIEKQQRAQRDWEVAMQRQGVVQTPSGKLNIRSANQVIHEIMSGNIPSNVIHPPLATGAVAQVGRNALTQVVTKTTEELAPGKQLQLFDKILTDVPDYENARSALRAAEDAAIAQKIHPIWHDGIRVRLSDVLEATRLGNVPPREVLRQFGLSNMNKMSPEVRGAITHLTAQRSLNISEITANLSKHVTAIKDDVLNYSPTIRPTLESAAVVSGVKTAKELGMTNEEATAVRDLLKNVIDVDKLPAENWLDNAFVQLQTKNLKGTIDPKIIMKFNSMVVKATGQSYIQLGQKITGAKAIDTVMSHVATWWKRGDAKKYSQDVFPYGEENAKMRAKWARNMTKKYTSEERRVGMRVAQDVEKSTDANVNEVAGIIKDYAQRLYKVTEHGVNLNMTTTKSPSVAQASQLTMEDINQTIKDLGVLEDFQFVATKHTNAYHFNGKNRDYSKGNDWQRSWETHKPSDPIAFLYNLDLATEITTKKYALLDDFAGRWGSLTKDALHPAKSPLSRIHDFHFPTEINSQIIKVMDDLEVKNWGPHTKLGQYYATGLNAWKAGVTIYLPSHHIRNAMGDMFLMWLAGHNDPRAFIWSKRIMGAQKTRYREALGERGGLNKLDMVTDPRAQQWAATSGSDIVMRSGGTSLNADQLFLAAHQRGLLRDAYAYEDVYAQAPLGEVDSAASAFKSRLRQPFGGQVRGVATTVAEYREHYIRLAHFSSAVNKGLKKSKDLNEVFNSAAHEVRKWHPDGTDLTNWERKYARTIFPFYSWIRKSTPLLMQSLVTAPAKHLALPRGMQAIQGMLGIQGDSVLDPFPNDQLFPDWIKAYGIGPIGDAQSSNIVARWFGTLGKNMIDLEGKPYGYTIINPSTPLQDTVQQFGGFGPMDTLAGIGESLSPAAKIPMDLMKNSDFTGAPISKGKGGQGVAHYLLKQIPGLAPIQRVTDVGDRKRLNQEPGFDSEALVNMLTAAGVRGTSPYITGAEFEQKDRLRAKKRAEAGK